MINISENDIRKIEEVILEDQVIICLRREGEDEFVSLDKLSLGEKCSVILSILVVSEDRPLIIDEPEAEKHSEEDWYQPEWIKLKDAVKLNVYPEEGKKVLLNLNTK